MVGNYNPQSLHSKLLKNSKKNSSKTASNQFLNIKSVPQEFLRKSGVQDESETP
jgi:hypothetical protein